MAPAKPLDSLDPTFTVDPQGLPTEKVVAAPAEAAALEILSADPRLEAQVLAKSTLTLLAYVADEGPFDASLALKVDGNLVTVALHKGMNGVDVLEALTRAIPVGYEAAARDASLSEVLIVTVLRPPERKSTEPDITFLATDPRQMFRWAGRNKLRIEGRATRQVSIRSFVELQIEGYAVRLPLQGGDFPLSTAMRLRSALPKGYGALIELPMTPGGDVTLTILRRR